MRTSVKVTANERTLATRSPGRSRFPRVHSARNVDPGERRSKNEAGASAAMLDTISTASAIATNGVVTFASRNGAIDGADSSRGDHRARGGSECPYTP